MTNTTTQTHYPPGYLDESCGGNLIAAATVMLVASTVLLILRVYARTLTDAERGWDEYLLLPSWLLLLGLCICCFLSINLSGAGYHLPRVPEKALMGGMVVYVLDWFYLLSATLSRLSVVLLYLRIFIRPTARICCWIVFAFLICFCIAGLIANQLQCLPLSYNWSKGQPGHCFNQYLWWQVMNFPNIVADTAILLLPIETVYNLKTTLIRKLGIGLVFLTGSMGLIASSVRTSRFYQDFSGHTTDNTWVLADLLAWTVVEAGMYFCSACLISLRPLLMRFGKWVSGNAPGTPQPGFRQTIFRGSGYRAEVRALGRGGKRHRDMAGRRLDSMGSDDMFFSTERTRIGNGSGTHMNGSVAELGDVSPPAGQIVVKTTVDVESQPYDQAGSLYLPIQVPDAAWYPPARETNRR